MKNHERRQVGLLALTLSNDFDEAQYLLAHDMLKVPAKSIDFTKQLIDQNNKASASPLISEKAIADAQKYLAARYRGEELTELDEIAKIFLAAVSTAE